MSGVMSAAPCEEVAGSFGAAGVDGFEISAVGVKDEHLVFVVDLVGFHSADPCRGDGSVPDPRHSCDCQSVPMRFFRCAARLIWVA